ncbi:MAG: PadR family transcriptional regulator [Sporichthyaceae bacterium]|nr:PadR family transcriptional regulator [Sporichthyaceae bacterium]
MGVLSDFGRFSEPALFVLISLLDSAKHGYAIVADIESFAGRRLGPGTLYGALGRLERHGLVEPLAQSGRRKPYRLTAAGRAEVRRALDEMRALAAHGDRRLHGLQGGAA